MDGQPEPPAAQPTDAAYVGDARALAAHELAAHELNERLGTLDRRQIAIWRAMTPARRLEIAFQAYQFVLDAVRLTERRRHPELSDEELAWRVTRRIQGNPHLGR